MKALISKMLDTRWGSTKFALTVGSFATFTFLLWWTKLSQDNYLLLAGGILGGYLSVNLLQHKTYAKGGGDADPQ